MTRDQAIDRPLEFDPFDGDYGGSGSGDKLFFDRMVKGRKAHRCSHCNGPIALGEVHRSRSEKYDGEMMNWRWCAACCAAMVAVVTWFASEQSDDEGDDSSEDELAFERRLNCHGPAEEEP